MHCVLWKESQSSVIWQTYEFFYGLTCQHPVSNFNSSTGNVYRRLTTLPFHVCLSCWFQFLTFVSNIFIVSLNQSALLNVRYSNCFFSVLVRLRNLQRVCGVPWNILTEASAKSFLRCINRQHEWTGWRTIHIWGSRMTLNTKLYVRNHQDLVSSTKKPREKINRKMLPKNRRTPVVFLSYYLSDS